MKWNLYFSTFSSDVVITKCLKCENDKFIYDVQSYESFAIKNEFGNRKEKIFSRKMFTAILIVLLARLVDFFYDANEDAKHHENYHICAEIVSCAVVIRCAIYFCFCGCFFAGLFFALLLQLVNLLEFFLNFGHQVREEFPK